MSSSESSPPSPPLRALLLSAALLAAGPAAALDLRPEAVGVEIDLLPTVASAVAGEPGGALQLWAGADRNRLRLVGAHLHYPDGLTDPWVAYQPRALEAEVSVKLGWAWTLPR